MDIALSKEKQATALIHLIQDTKVKAFLAQTHSNKWYVLHAHQANLTRKWRQLKTLESV